MRRIILRGGRVVDPAHRIDQIGDLVMEGNRIAQCGADISPEAGDRVIDCEGLEIWPGLIDIHLHIGDLFEIDTASVFRAAEHGVTMGLSPGAGNTFMAPALLGAEMDRGLMLNVGVFLGAANVLGGCLDCGELIRLFRGELPQEICMEKLSRNPIVNRTAKYVVGIKEHMGHFLLPDERIDQIYEVTEQAGLLFLSHTQDISHTLRLCELAKGRHLHLGHANAAGCGTHGDPVESMREVIRLCGMEEFTGEFVTTMLRPDRGSREGLKMDEKARELALSAIEQGIVKILVSDGQNQSVMKGFGDTRDNIPCILELTSEGVLPRMDAVAMMTCNPVELMAVRTGNASWRDFGHLAPGAYANVTVVEPRTGHAVYVFTNGCLVAFEQRCLRSGGKAGYWVSRFGVTENIGVGNLAIFQER